MAEIFQDDSINMLEKISRFFGDTLLGRIAFVVIVCLAAWAGISIIVHVLRSLLHKSRIDDVGNVMILRITRILLWILVIMSLLSSLGVKMASFVTMLATAGAAVALALRDSLANLASGIILLVTHPFGKDDKIEVNGAVGSVVAIDIMTTTLLTVSGKRVTVPNSMMTSNIVTNHTSEGRTQAEKQHILSRSSDILKAEEIIRSVIDEEPLILAEPKPYVGISAQDGNTVTLSVGYWVNLENFGSASFQYEERIREAFDRSGIQFARKTLDLGYTDRQTGRENESEAG